MALSLVMLTIAVSAGVLYHLRHRKLPTGPLLHVRNEFEFTVHAPYKIAANLAAP